MFFLTGFKASFGFSNIAFIAVTAWNGINSALLRLYIHGVFDGSEKVAPISHRIRFDLYFVGRQASFDFVSKPRR